MMNDHARGCQGREYTCTCGYDDQQEALIRELLVTLEQIAEATYDDRPASRFQLIDWARCALAKAKAAGYPND